MPAFHYVIINTQGKEQKGVLEAESEKHARELLRKKAWIPIKVQLSQTKKTTKVNNFFKWRPTRGLKSKELALITRQFATLLAAGLPLEEALLAVSEQIERGHIQGLILSVRSKVLEGHSLATALKEFPEHFSGLYAATVAAGEKSGHLDKVLARLADYTEQQWQMQQKLKTALIYPSVIILVAVGIVGFLLEYVVPKMVGVYGHLNQSLPMMTEVLISISNFVKNKGLYCLLIIGIVILIWRHFYKKNENLRERTHLFLLRLPLIGYFIKTADTARFSRTLSILSASGVPVLEAMNIASQLILSIPIKRAVAGGVKKIREGTAIHLALKQTTFFSPMSVHMVASGEASGQLESMLERVAFNQEQEIVRLIEVALALFEPIIIIVMGAIILFIVLAVLLPIFQLNQFTG